MMLKVAVIGSGPSGLASLRRLQEKSERFEPVAFEQADRLGGNWVYTDITPYCSNAHSSVYKNLRTNLAKESMYFPEFPFPSHLPSYVMHWDMLHYLEDFARHFDLYKYIKFSRKVINVKPFKQGEKTKWLVEVEDTTTNNVPNEIFTFDAIFVCTGHFALPRIPEITGLHLFGGLVMHSHFYRDPAQFVNKLVICIGGGHSGADIALDISSCATKVLWSHSNKPYDTELPHNLEQASVILEAKCNSVVFADGREEIADAIILCTGYHYHFPFLHADCHVNIEKGRVKPIYKHIIHTELPSLSFIGLCTRHCTFPQIDGQVQFALAALDESMQLPSKVEMDQDAENDFKYRLQLGICNKKPHELAWVQWDYHEELARLANFKSWPIARRALCENSILRWNTNLKGFRNINYKITDENSESGWEVIN